MSSDRIIAAMVSKVSCSSCRASILPETAARTGGVCMQCQRLGPPSPSEMVLHARRTPARCIASFRATEEDAGTNRWETIDRARFRLACPCGGSDFRIQGDEIEGATGLGGKLQLTCATCGEERDAFNPEQDGYDAEIEDAPARFEHDARRAHVCSACQHRVFEVDATLYYQLEEENADDWPELAERPQDFFTAFTLGARFTHCGSRTEPAAYECA